MKSCYDNFESFVRLSQRPLIGEKRYSSIIENIDRMVRNYWVGERAMTREGKLFSFWLITAKVRKGKEGRERAKNVTVAHTGRKNVNYNFGTAPTMQFRTKLRIVFEVGNKRCSNNRCFGRPASASLDERNGGRSKEWTLTWETASERKGPTQAWQEKLNEILYS